MTANQHSKISLTKKLYNQTLTLSNNVLGYRRQMNPQIRTEFLCQYLSTSICFSFLLLIFIIMIMSPTI